MKRLIGVKGDILLKRITVKVFAPGNKQSTLQAFMAQSGEGITPEGIENILNDIAEQIDKHWPDEEYGLVAMGQGAFNFVWRKKKEQESEGRSDGTPEDQGCSTSAAAY